MGCAVSAPQSYRQSIAPLQCRTPGCQQAPHPSSHSLGLCAKCHQNQFNAAHHNSSRPEGQIHTPAQSHHPQPSPAVKPYHAPPVAHPAVSAQICCSVCHTMLLIPVTATNQFGCSVCKTVLQIPGTQPTHNTVTVRQQPQFVEYNEFDHDYYW